MVTLQSRRTLMPRPLSSGQSGFTYLGLLFAIALIGIGLLAISEVWTTTARRQKLIELEWIGAQYERAIGSYYDATPGTAVKAYPQSLKDLLTDRRYVTTRRHLRQIYPNPFTGRVDWQYMRAADGGIRGIRVEVPVGAKTAWLEFVHVRQGPPASE